MKWDEKEETYLKKNYQKLSLEKIAQNLNRNVSSVYWKGLAIGLKRKRGGKRNSGKRLTFTKWSVKDKEYIIQNYSKKNINELSKRMNRTKESIYSMAKILKLKKDITKENNSAWKGNNASYSSIHRWVTKYKPKPSLCELCLKNKPRDLAKKKSKRYTRNTNNYMWLCDKCHFDYDNVLPVWRKGFKKWLNNGGRVIISQKAKERKVVVKNVP